MTKNVVRAALAATLAVTGLLATAGSAAAAGTATAAAPASVTTASATVGQYAAVISGHGDALHPESASWDPIHRQFVVSSIHQGVVSRVGADGTARPLVTDPRLVSALGVKVDAAHGRVLVCNADPAGLSVRSTAQTPGHVAGLGSYDLTTGRPLWYVDLAAVAGDGGRHLANDVVSDADGTAYVTDSFAPIVYRVTADGHASVLLRDDRIGAGPGQFGLNGIVLRGGRLFLGNYATGAVWELPLHRPQALRLLVADPRLAGLDGLAAGPDGSLVGVTNRIGVDSSGTVVTVRPGADRGPATVTARPSADPAPTAVTRGRAVRCGCCRGGWTSCSGAGCRTRSRCGGCDDGVARRGTGPFRK
ncbi:SMP-30/gluconolactonase/LRE family protein [Kitasatospora acidiphila]|uniref:SMP-30/gluconolactonase/LRE family protein n=1 Tax=Kitasatospora acidiphila TaxID=2567942 RepID=A0A540WA79_9ACTN|nr:SMP-30/gluconolactonase/LRE family protein [Kitasatospora acidiphila]TQF05925.1 SMP-30/gluconolactonase/LRE family protein [Kitasatospora acidiphila]